MKGMISEVLAVMMLLQWCNGVGTRSLPSSYSTTNKMHLFLKLFILVKRSTCFGRSFRPSSGAQNCAYSNGTCQTAAATGCYRG